MDIFSICRICLNQLNTNFVSIYSHLTPTQCDFNDSIITANNDQTQISSILDTLTGNKYVCIANSIEIHFIHLYIHYFHFRIQMNFHTQIKYVICA